MPSVSIELGGLQEKCFQLMRGYFLYQTHYTSKYLNWILRILSQPFLQIKGAQNFSDEGQNIKTLTNFHDEFIYPKFYIIITTPSPSILIGLPDI